MSKPMQTSPFAPTDPRAWIHQRPPRTAEEVAELEAIRFQPNVDREIGLWIRSNAHDLLGELSRMDLDDYERRRTNAIAQGYADVERILNIPQLDAAVDAIRNAPEPDIVADADRVGRKAFVAALGSGSLDAALAAWLEWGEEIKKAQQRLTRVVQARRTLRLRNAHIQTWASRRSFVFELGAMTGGMTSGSIDG